MHLHSKETHVLFVASLNKAQMKKSLQFTVRALIMQV